MQQLQNVDLSGVLTFLSEYSRLILVLIVGWYLVAASAGEVKDPKKRSRRRLITFLILIAIASIYYATGARDLRNESIKLATNQVAEWLAPLMPTVIAWIRDNWSWIIWVLCIVGFIALIVYVRTRVNMGAWAAGLAIFGVVWFGFDGRWPDQPQDLGDDLGVVVPKLFNDSLSAVDVTTPVVAQLLTENDLARAVAAIGILLLAIFVVLTLFRWVTRPRGAEFE